MSVNRGEIYWDHFKDATGRDRKVPLLVVSTDNYNTNSLFVTGVRLVQYDNRPCPQHVHVPASAFERTMILGDCVALCETVSSIRQTALSGPIGVLGEAYMAEVENGIRYQLGMGGNTTTGKNEFHTYAASAWMGVQANTGSGEGK